MNKIALGLVAMILFFSCSCPGKREFLNKQTLPSAPLIAEAKTFIPVLSDKINEISGMLVWKNLYWGFNDSGGDAVLFGFDDTGKIIMEVELENAVNRDWESITQDEDFLYVGDFGNNFGNRKDLCIYKISKKKISDKAEQKVATEKINIQYAAQKDFDFMVNTTPFDCEAMTESNGELYLFSKNWRDHSTTIYRLSTQPGTYFLDAIDTLSVNLLVTGADISRDKIKLALIGYLDYKTYLWIFSGFANDDFGSGESTYINLKNTDGAQTEGIYFLNSDSLLISTEQTKEFNQQVFLFDLNTLNYGTHQSQ